MARKLALYALAFLGILLVVQAVISAVFAALAVIWSMVMMAVTAGLLLAAGYGIYKLYSAVSHEDATKTEGRNSTQTRERSRVDRLQTQYARGDISERELERRLERELDSRATDSIDRELQRDRR